MKLRPPIGDHSLRSKQSPTTKSYHENPACLWMKLPVWIIALALSTFLTACKKDAEQPVFDEVVRLSFDRRIPHDDHFHSAQNPTIVSFDSDGNPNVEEIVLAKGQRYQLNIEFFEQGTNVTDRDFLGGPVDNIANRIFLLFTPHQPVFYPSSETAYERLKEWRTGLKSEFLFEDIDVFELTTIVQRNLDISDIPNKYDLSNPDFQEDFGGLTAYRLKLTIRSADKDIDDAESDFGH